MSNNACYIIFKEIQFKGMTASTYEQEERTQDFLIEIFMYISITFFSNCQFGQTNGCLTEG